MTAALSVSVPELIVIVVGNSSEFDERVVVDSEADRGSKEQSERDARQSERNGGEDSAA